MARTKAEAHYHVAHGYLARYKRTKAQSVRFANRTLPETSNDGPNLNPNTTTLPFDEPPSSPRITRSKALHRTSPQTQSFLLTKLPPEIRHLVWVAVVGGLEIQIIPRLHYGVALGVHHRCHCPNTQRHTCSLLRCVVDDAEAKTNLLSLLLTCRRTYVETAPVLYRSNKFIFANFETIQLFRASIFPSHWRHIRSVRARDPNILWTDKWRSEVFRLSCEDVLGLPALQEFTLRIRRSVGVLDVAGLVTALGALKKLDRRAVRLVLEVEGRRDFEAVREAIGEAGMWKVTLVELLGE